MNSDLINMPIVEDRVFYGWDYRRKRPGFFKLRDIQKVDSINDSMMVKQELRIPKRPETIFDVVRQQGIKLHSDDQKKRLKEAKAFHKEYGQCLNNQKAKQELAKSIVEGMKRQLGFNLVLSGNFDC